MGRVKALWRRDGYDFLALLQALKAMRTRLLCYTFMGILSPGILFTFVVLFGSDSYQIWFDRYHYFLTNKTVFAHLQAKTALEPLWRDDVLTGNIWIVSLVTSPLALDSLLGRWFYLSPMGIELVGNLTLYAVAVVSMFVFLRQALQLSLEAATAAAVPFAATAYWEDTTFMAGSPAEQMAIVWLPGLLAMVHRVHDAAVSPRKTALIVPVAVLSLLVYLCALHGGLATLPAALVLVVVYAWVIYRSWWSSLWTVAALGMGLVLYAPFLWAMVEASRLSHRFMGAAHFPRSGVDLDLWLTRAKNLALEVAVGHNRFGIYVAVLAVLLVWWCLGSRWQDEPLRIRRVVLFAAGVTAATFLNEFLQDWINYAKRGVPFFGGWDIRRFSFFSFFGVVTLTAWMMDRSVFRPRQTAPAPGLVRAVRVGVAGLGLLAALQIAYSLTRMRQVPSEVYPQTLVLNGYFVLYAAVTFAFLVWLYRGISNQEGASGIFKTQTARLWGTALIVLSVSLGISVHAYRAGILTPPSMTYAQRYAVPEDVAAVKRLNVRDGRVADLTRPLTEATWTAPQGNALAMLPVAGLKTPSVYNNLMPAWSEQFMLHGINGGAGGLAFRMRNITEVRDAGRTNFEALAILDVQYILAGPEQALPFYQPVVGFESAGKTLYALPEEARLGPAFVSPGIRCFPTDEEALRHINAASFRELTAQAVLVAHDPGTASLCAGRSELMATARTDQVQIRTQRGHDQVSIDVDSGAGGIVTLSDTYYPGWRVFVDDREETIIRTYVNFRGVRIAPGHHRVTFVYEPRIFWILLRLSAGLLLVMLVTMAAVWMWERRREAALDAGFGSRAGEALPFSPSDLSGDRSH